MRIGSGLLCGHVLQRQPNGARTVVTGSCNCSGTVTVTVYRKEKIARGFNKKAAGQSEAGRFTATISGLPAGGPYTVELACGGARIVVDDVFVGDLWLMAGQSNMQGMGNVADADSPHPLVRNFSMARRWELARDPLHFLEESPDPVHCALPLSPREASRAKKRAVKGVGVGVPFGKLMLQRTRVPQGLIATAHGGTSMDDWAPALKDRGGSSLYGSMTLSLTAIGQPISGVLWFQGEDDCREGRVAVYTAKMQELVSAVRRDLGQPKLPWIIAQIGRSVGPYQDLPAPWVSRVQEQQRRFPESIAQCDVVPTIDLEIEDTGHVSARAFPVLAQRMARVAARLAYGDRAEKPAPQPVSARFFDAARGNGAEVEVRFKNIVEGLTSSGLPQGFALVDRAGRSLQRIYKTLLAGDRARLYLDGEAVSLMRVMYGYGQNPVCNVCDGRGMAIPAFGPLAITGLPPFSDFVLKWRVTPVCPGEAIADMPRPSEDDQAIDREFRDKFVTVHPEWVGKSGHVAFFGDVIAGEDMDAEFHFGYDGPVRVWVGTQEVYADPHGTNPIVPDAHRIAVRLKPGRSPVTVLMALNNGRAWGFCLRMQRPGYDPATDPMFPQPWQ